MSNAAAAAAASGGFRKFRAGVLAVFFGASIFTGTYFGASLKADEELKEVRLARAYLAPPSTA